MIEVTKLLEHFLEYCSHAVFSYKLKVCKECARKPNRVWSGGRGRRGRRGEGEEGGVCVC